jgi:hypothetical protein
MNQEDTGEKKEQPKPQGYEEYHAGWLAEFIFISHRKTEQTKYKRYYPRWYHNIGNRIRYAARAVGDFLRRYAPVAILIVTVCYTRYAGRQWDTMQGQLTAMQASNTQNERVFQATQRAAVYLGLPDGKFAEFASQREKLQVLLYFRNYGGQTARDTIVEAWPIATSVDHPSYMVKVPPFPAPRPNRGPDLPPGFPSTSALSTPDLTQSLVETGQIDLKVMGRISYRDDFGSHCDSFSADYIPTLKSFSLTSTDVLCDGKPHEIYFCNMGGVMLSEMEVMEGSGVKIEFGCEKTGPVIPPQQEEKHH